MAQAEMISAGVHNWMIKNGRRDAAHAARLVALHALQKAYLRKLRRVERLNLKLTCARAEIALLRGLLDAHGHGPQAATVLQTFPPRVRPVELASA